MPVTLVHSTPHNANTHHTRSFTPLLTTQTPTTRARSLHSSQRKHPPHALDRSLSLSLAVPYSLPCSLERKTLTLTLEFKTGSAGYLKISKIKKSLQFGWVEKLQRTSGFQTVRGGYLVFFQNPFENHRYINLDTHRHRLTDRSQTDWPASVGRNYTEAVCPTVRAGSPIQILSVRPSDCPGRFSHTNSVCPSVRLSGPVLPVD